MRRTLFALVALLGVPITHIPAECPAVPAPEALVKPLHKNVHVQIQKDATKIVLGYVEHTVKPGDTLWTLSRDYTVLEWMIHQANPKLEKFIQPGQVVKIPLVAWKPYEGPASWYGPGFHRKRAASGKIYNQNEISLAHSNYPFGLDVKIVRPKNNLSVVGKVNDRGRFKTKYHREVDLSYRAARDLGMIQCGVDEVRIIPQNTHLTKWVSGYSILL